MQHLGSVTNFLEFLDGKLIQMPLSSFKFSHAWIEQWNIELILFQSACWLHLEIEILHKFIVLVFIQGDLNFLEIVLKKSIL